MNQRNSVYVDLKRIMTSEFEKIFNKVVERKRVFQKVRIISGVHFIHRKLRRIWAAGFELNVDVDVSKALINIF